MTGFTEFLLENTTKLSEESFLKALRQHCNNSHNAAKTSGLFTSFKSEADFLMIDPTSLSKRNSFMIDELIELLPSWKNTPFRRQAIIGYTSLSSARLYAAKDETPYVLLPYDKATICMVNAKSFYIGCEAGCRSLSITSVSNGQLRAWLSSLRRAAKKLGIATTSEEPVSGKQLLKALMALEELKDIKKLKELKLDEDDMERAEVFASRAGTVLEFLSSVFDPDANGVSKVLAIHHNMPADREVWTNTSCLLVSLDAYRRLHEAGKIK
jgi:transposase-like protein